MSRRIADLLIKIGADSYEFQQKTKQVEKGLDGVSKKLTSIGKNLTMKLTAPLAALGGVSVALADTQAKAEAKVQQAIKTTAGAAKLSFDQLAAFASELQGKTIFGDENILNNATAQLLTFTNIAGENFKRTQAIALDLSTVLDGDLKSASIQLGKALNDPIKNLSALSRSGIQFSKEQTAVIKSLAETGRLAEAQSVILDELERQYSGQAEAQAKVGAGALVQLKNSWGDFMEQIGAVILPGLNKMVGVLQKVVAWLQSLSPTTKNIMVVIAGAAASIGPLLLALGAIVKILPLLKAGIMALSSPMAGLIGLAAMLAAGLCSAFNSYSQLQSLKTDQTKQHAIEVVASGEWKVENLDYLKKIVADAQQLLNSGNVYNGDWIDSSTGKTVDGYEKYKSYNENLVEQYSAVIIELEKKKKLEDEALATQKKMTAEAKNYATEVTNWLQGMTALSDVTKENVSVEVERKVAPLVSDSIELEPIKATLEVETPLVTMISSFQQKMATIRDAVEGSIYSWADSSSKAFNSNIKSTSDIVAKYVDSLTSKGWKFSDALQEVTSNISSTIASVNSTLNSGITNIVTTSLDAVGQIIGGIDLGFDDFMKLILAQTANFLKQLGTQLIEFGIVMIGFKKALAALLSNPWLAIGVGAAMVVAAGVMTAIANKNAEDNIPKLASGGLAYGATYAMVGDNPNASVDPEVIAPLSKLKKLIKPQQGGVGGKVEFEIKGRVLQGILRKIDSLDARVNG